MGVDVTCDVRYVCAAVDVDARFCADRRIVTGVDLRAACRMRVGAERAAVLGVDVDVDADAAARAVIGGTVCVAVVTCSCAGTCTSCVSVSVSSSDEACRYLAYNACIAACGCNVDVVVV